MSEKAMNASKNPILLRSNTEPQNRIVYEDTPPFRAGSFHLSKSVNHILTEIAVHFYCSFHGNSSLTVFVCCDTIKVTQSKVLGYLIVDWRVVCLVDGYTPLFLCLDFFVRQEQFLRLPLAL